MHTQKRRGPTSRCLVKPRLLRDSYSHLAALFPCRRAPPSIYSTVKVTAVDRDNDPAETVTVTL